MLKLCLTATFIILAILATLTGCSDTTPAPEEVPTPTQVSSRTAAPTSTDAPVSTQAPTKRPTAAPTATPASPPTLEPKATPVPPGVLSPLQALDSTALLSELSDTELACIGDNPEKLARSLAGPGSAPREEQAKLIGCLSDETLARIFLAGFVPGLEPLSQETSDCVRAGFAVIGPRAVMTAGMEGDPGRAMAGSTAAFSVTIACLNDEEWDAAKSMMGMEPDERKGMRCLLDQLGGPAEMAEAMKTAGEGDFTQMARAGTDCGLDMGRAPGQAPVTPPQTPPTPTATVEASTSVPTSTPIPTRTAPTTTLVIIVAPIPTNIPEYDRGDWRHWIDEDGDCQDVRQEVLVVESLPPVTFETDRGCRVATGRWFGAFTGVYVEDPGDLDIDHLVPLKNAHLSGGWAWSSERKEEYANYLGEENHLIAVTAGATGRRGRRDRRSGVRQTWTTCADTPPTGRKLRPGGN